LLTNHPIFQSSNPLSQDLDHILMHTEGLWEELRCKRIFITGGTGFFGIWILEALAWANAKLNLNLEAIVLTRDIGKFLKKAPHIANSKLFSFIEDDVIKFKYPKQKFNYIIHAAADFHMEHRKKSSLMVFDTIVEGTHHVLDFAIKCKADKFLYISSGAVYGKQPNTMSHISEDYMGAADLTLLDSTYAEGKRSAEMLCTLYSNTYDLSIKIARCFAFVGPYLQLNNNFAIGNFISSLLKNEKIVIHGDGTPVRSYMYVSDLIVWLINILIRGRNCYPYNVGSEDEISIEDLAKTIAGFSKKPLAVEIETIKSDSYKIDRYVPSTQRAQKELGLKQRVPLNDGILKTIKFNSGKNNFNAK
jgi:nucleoside-diphosphate-sugar epimerase